MPRLTASCKRSKRTWSRCSTAGLETTNRIYSFLRWQATCSTKRRTSRQARKARLAMSNHDSYEQFLASKRVQAVSSGIDVSIEELHPMLFDWQKSVVQWALKKG